MSNYYNRQGEQITQEQWYLLSREDFEIARRVANTKIREVTVSTVFLGLNHNWDNGPPLIFETMVFGGEHGGWQVRYSTEAQALAGHESAVAWVRGERDEP